MSGRREPDIIAAARLNLNRWLPIQPHESVVIIASTATYEPILNAFFGAVIESGADPTLVMVKDRGPLGMELPKAAVDCASGADVVIDLQHLNWGYSDSRNRVIRAMQEKGGRYKEFHGLEEDVDHFCTLLPDPVVQARSERMAAIVDGARRFQIRSDDGTDLNVERGDPLERPCFAPQGQAAFSPPEDGTDGTLMFKGGIRVQGPTLIKMMAYHPVRLEIERGRLVHVARDTEVGAFLDDWLRSIGDPGAYRFAHINFGVDHRVKLHHLDNFAVHFNYGGILCAFGTNYTARFTGPDAVRVRSHIETQNVGQSLWADGELILDRGRFTPESGVTPA